MPMSPHATRSEKPIRLQAIFAENPRLLAARTCWAWYVEALTGQSRGNGSDHQKEKQKAGGGNASRNLRGERGVGRW